MNYPTKPVIRKLGTIWVDLVEATPIVFHNTLYRFEYIRSPMRYPKNDLGVSYFHFVNVRTNQASAPFALDHHLGSAYVEGDTVYAFGITRSHYEHEWGSDTVHFYRSTDLENWEQFSEIHLPGWEMYNCNLCKMGDTYTLLVEIGAPEEEAGQVPYTFRFLQSKDLLHWEVTPSECVFNKDRYAGGPAIYTLPDDPHYYVFYLEDYPHYRFGNAVARSKDLIHWEYSPINPVLMYDDAEDKKIASPFLTAEEQAKIKKSLDINNSDMEICEFNGRTIIYYSWGCQHRTEYLAEAAYEGSMKDFITGFFCQED